MIHTGFYLEDFYLEDQLDDSLDWSELEMWGDAPTETSEYFLAMQKLPTEQELLEMEATQDNTQLGEGLFKRERRTALRH